MINIKSSYIYNPSKYKIQVWIPGSKPYALS